MKIKKVMLDNFRCYRHEEIDLSADITAIYARNGTGKTAIFDAIEFALLGDIYRFENFRNIYSADSDFLSCVHTLDDPSIKIEFCNDDNNSNFFSISWQRGYIDNAQIKLNDLPMSRNEFLFNFLSDEKFFSKRDIGIIKELFRSTLLFSQYHLRDFIENKDNKDRFRILSYLAGMLYFQKCLDRTKAVIKEAKIRIDRFEKLKKEINEKYKNSKLELEEINGKIDFIKKQLGEKLPSLEEIIKDLEKIGVSINNQYDASLSDTDLLLSFIHGRSEEKKYEILNRQSEIQNLLEDIKLLPSHENELSILTENINTYKNRETEIKQLIEKIDTEIFEMNNEIKNTRNNYNHYIMMSNKLSQLARLLNDINEYEKNYKEATQQVSNLKTQMEKEETEYNSQITILQQKEDKYYENQITISKLSSKLNKLKDLKDKIPSYIDAKTKVSIIQKKKKELLELLEKNQLHKAELDAKCEEIKRKLSETYRTLEIERKRTSEVSDLLARLSQYVIDQECPLCGHDHDSSLALKKAIETKIAKLPENLKILTSEYEKYSKMLVNIESEIKDTIGNIESINDMVDEVDKTYSQKMNLINEVEYNAKQMNQSLDESDINNKIEQIEESLNKLIKENNELEAQINEIKIRIRNIEYNLEQIKEKIKYSENSAHQAARNLIQAKDRLEISGMDKYLGMSIEQIETEADIFNKRATENEILISEKEALKSKKENEIKLLFDEKEIIIRKNNEATETIKRINIEIERIMNYLEREGIRRESVHSEIQKKLESLSEEIKIVNEILDKTNRYKLLRNLNILQEEKIKKEQEYNSILIELNDIDESIKKTRNARERVMSWEEKISDKVNNVIEKRISMHLPEINKLFKQMIPYPFLYEGITIMRGKNMVNLGIKYKGIEQQSGEPVFFLSNGQANILALAIFFSFAGKQKWSRLDTILLDDPVEHLDDLDALALIDSIRNMVMGSFRKKQIIISTCDYNLYLLMIKKFRALCSSDIDFTAISLIDRGDMGPEVIYDYGKNVDNRMQKISM